MLGKNSPLKSIFHEYDKYMYLELFIDSMDKDLINRYKSAITEHNNKIYTNIEYIDAGFDLYSPDSLTFTSSNVNKLDYYIICKATMVEKTGETYNTGFYMYPRSSISKNNIRLANNVGIIDAGYRGHLIGMFDVIYSPQASVGKFDRHLQICAPSLIPIVVSLVNTREELGTTTRGAGGFGSTGV